MTRNKECIASSVKAAIEAYRLHNGRTALLSINTFSLTEEIINEIKELQSEYDCALSIIESNALSYVDKLTGAETDKDINDTLFGLFNILRDIEDQIRTLKICSSRSQVVGLTTAR